MVFASSLFSVQSFVNLKTNSNYSHPSCYIPRVKNSYLNLSYKNISHIESSNSLFFKGDNNFSISLPKFPKIASTYSPSLNIIKACNNQNIYHYPAFEMVRILNCFHFMFNDFRIFTIQFSCYFNFSFVLLVYNILNFQLFSLYQVSYYLLLLLYFCRDFFNITIFNFNMFCLS